MVLTVQPQHIKTVGATAGHCACFSRVERLVQLTYANQHALLRNCGMMEFSRDALHAW